MAVFGLLLAMIFGVVQSASKLADSSERGGDSDIEARQVLDRIGMDIAGMVIRPDVDQLYYKNDFGAGNAGNDAMFFYSQQAGYLPPATLASQSSPVTLVGYRINTTDHVSAEPILERLALGLTWDGDPASPTAPSMQFLAFPVKANANDYPVANGGTIPSQWAAIIGAAPYDNGVSTYYDTVGSQIFRLEICFQLKSGDFSQNPGYINSAPNNSGIGNTTAIIVAIATLDSKSRKLVPAAAWPALIGALSDSVAGDFAQTPPVLMDRSEEHTSELQSRP